MRRYNFILLMFIASLILGCERADLGGYEVESDATLGNVEVLADGSLKVTTSLERLGMTSIDTRANTTEDNIYNGWCLVFGKTTAGHNLVYETGESYGYGDDSPLIQITPITANANGTFFMTFSEFDDIAYMRIVVNLTDRENTTLGSVVSWQDIANLDADDGYYPTETPDHDTVTLMRDTGVEIGGKTYNLATFGQYRRQSVGLDGIYNIDYKTTAETKYTSTPYVDYTNQLVYWYVEYQTEGSGNTGKNDLTQIEETYNNVSPNPATDLNITSGFPMASYGWSLTDISAETLSGSFGQTVDMIRVCSKVVVDVTEAEGFDMQEVYMIDAAQEARIRSTVLSTSTTDADGNASVSSEFVVPKDLGGNITYEAMPVAAGVTVSDPIYFYPNSGGEYSYTTTANDNINPQYIIIKGQANGYDTPGYYKVALKAQYPLVKNADPDDMSDITQWSALTYDILRNTSFTVKVADIDKPGYKTYEDAINPDSPANNISYSITIESSNNHYEVLVSNGTYYVELASSRIYAKGYGTEGVTGEYAYVDFTMFPSEGNVVPSVYVQSNDYDNDDETEQVAIRYCEVLREGDAGYATDDWSNPTVIGLSTNNTGDGLAAQLVHIASDGDDATKETKVRVYFTATDSGRIRLRIGDMLKFIPIVYEAKAIQTAGETQLTITDEYGTTWDEFAYAGDSYIEIKSLTDGDLQYRLLNSDGSTFNNSGCYYNREMITRVFTSDNSGIAQMYLKQASDFNLWDNVTGGESVTSQAIVYQSTGNIYTITDGEANTSDTRSYTINGDVEFELTGDTELTNFNQEGNIALGETFTFYGSDIKTNQGDTYVAANSHLSNSTNITLTNIANETATYTIAVDQYALPYVETSYTTDSSGRMIFQGGKADLYGTASNNKGEPLDFIYVSNAYYTEVENYATTSDLGYHWETTGFVSMSSSELSSNTYENRDATIFSGEKYSLGRVFYAISVQHDEIDAYGNVQSAAGTTNRHQFYGKVNDKSGTLNRTGYGYFVLSIGNEANERLLLYIYYIREDGGYSD